MDQPKEIKIGIDAKNSIKKGIDTVANVVKSTLGSQGKYVIIDHDSMPHLVTNDGVTVAKNIVLKDKFENLGAKLIKEVANKTNLDSGDGTTTATVLAQAIIEGGMRNIIAGRNPISIKNGIEIATRFISNSLTANAKSIEHTEIENIANISANSKDIGKLIAEAYSKIGRDGIVMIEESKLGKTEIELVEGLTFDRGWLSQYFITNPRRLETVYEDCNVLICDDSIQSPYEFMDFLNKYVAKPEPLLIVASNIEGEALAFLVYNRLQGKLPCVAIKSPGFGERRRDLLEDIAAVTGATIVKKDLGMKLNSMGLEVLGKAKKVVVGKEKTIIVTHNTDKNKEALQERILIAKSQLEQAESEYDKEKLKERLGKLTGGLAIINVGGKTESEMVAHKYKIEDAVNAVKSALEAGVLPGGGYALIMASSDKPGVSDADIAVGVDIVYNAVKEPLKQIAFNAGKDGNIILNKVLETGKLYNATTGEFEDISTTSIIDPAKVTRSALENASSIACLLLTTDALIVEEIQEGK